MRFQFSVLVAVPLILAGCSASTENVGSLVLPTSNKKIDVVQHRTDNKGCTTGFVLQTYSGTGDLIDSKGGYGTSLGCRTVDGLIRAGGQVGAAALIADGIRDSADRTTINNSNSQSQAQSQGQWSANVNKNANANVNVNANYAEGGKGGHGGHGGNGEGNGGSGGQGNNGSGNGTGDGTNPGTDNHNDNGDNN